MTRCVNLNPVFTNDGGDVWFEMSRVNFSKDGQRYTFATREREKELLRIYVGDSASNAKPKSSWSVAAMLDTKLLTWSPQSRLTANN